MHSIRYVFIIVLLSVYYYLTSCVFARPVMLLHIGFSRHNTLRLSQRNLKLLTFIMDINISQKINEHRVCRYGPEAYP